MNLAKADIVPKDANLRTAYDSFTELEAACDEFMDEVNNREHRATRRKSAAMLIEQQPRLHRVPGNSHTVAFGLARTVPANTPMVAFENARYSVPARPLGARVFVRSHGIGADEQVIIVHVGSEGPIGVARHGARAEGGPGHDPTPAPSHGRGGVQPRAAFKHLVLGDPVPVPGCQLRADPRRI